MDDVVSYPSEYAKQCMKDEKTKSVQASVGLYCVVDFSVIVQDGGY